MKIINIIACVALSMTVVGNIYSANFGNNDTISINPNDIDQESIKIQPFNVEYFANNKKYCIHLIKKEFYTKYDKYDKKINYAVCDPYQDRFYTLLVDKNTKQYCYLTKTNNIENIYLNILDANLNKHIDKHELDFNNLQVIDNENDLQEFINTNKLRDDYIELVDKNVENEINEENNMVDNNINEEEDNNDYNEENYENNKILNEMEDNLEDEDNNININNNINNNEFNFNNIDEDENINNMIDENDENKINELNDAKANTEIQLNKQLNNIKIKLNIDDNVLIKVSDLLNDLYNGTYNYCDIVMEYIYDSQFDKKLEIIKKLQQDITSKLKQDKEIEDLALEISSQDVIDMIIDYFIYKVKLDQLNTQLQNIEEEK